MTGRVAPEASLFSRTLLYGATFAEAAQAAAEWLTEHEDTVAVIRVEFGLVDSDTEPVHGAILYTEA